MIVNLWLGLPFFSRNQFDFSNIDWEKVIKQSIEEYYDNYRIEWEEFQVTPRNTVIEVNPDGSFFYGIDLTLKYDKFFIKGYYKHYKWKYNFTKEFTVDYKYKLKITYEVYGEEYTTSYEDEDSVSIPISFRGTVNEDDYGIIIGIFF